MIKMKKELSLVEEKDSLEVDRLKKINEYKNDMNILIMLLDRETKNFDSENFMEKIHEIVNNNKKILYSHLSSQIFSIYKNQNNPDDRISLILSNLDAILTKIDEINNEQVIKILLKLYDHINLANNQYVGIAESNDEFNIKTKPLMDKIKLAEINSKRNLEELEKLKDGIYAQLISIVGIFTALAFLVFGGINYIENIFQSVGRVPIVELMIVGSIWGICITNMIFIFMYFIAKLIGKPLWRDGSRNGNMVQRYPLMFWSNWFIISIFLISCWIKVIDKYDMGGIVFDWLSKMWVVIIGTAIIFLIIVSTGVGIIVLLKNNKNKTDI